MWSVYKNQVSVYTWGKTLHFKKSDHRIVLRHLRLLHRIYLMANYPLGIENVFPVSACPPASYTYTYTYSYCLSGAWVLSHPLLSRQLPSNSSIPLYSQTTVNNYHALLSLLPVWSGAHTTWVSPLPYFSAHCAGALPALRSLRVGSQEWAVEGQGGKSRLRSCHRSCWERSL